MEASSQNRPGQIWTWADLDPLDGQTYSCKVCSLKGRGILEFLNPWYAGWMKIVLQPVVQKVDLCFLVSSSEGKTGFIPLNFFEHLYLT